MINGDPTSTFGFAWLVATIAFALHVADEATHDFLAWYNPRALRIRQILGGFPFPPTFTFLPWLLGLLAAVVVLGFLTRVAYTGTQWIRPVGYALGGIHIVNGLIHIVGSITARRLVPGAYSAPLLLLTGGWLAYTAAVLQ